MMAGQQRELASRLQAFVVAAYTDDRFQRSLQYSPQAALASHGLSWEEPGPLPISCPLTSLRFDDATLSGIAISSGQHRRFAEENTETRLCLARSKPLLLNHAPEAEAASMVRRFHELGLVALLSAYEFVPEADQLKSGYSNSMSGLKPAQPGSGAWRTVVAGFEPGRVMLAWLCLLFGWHELLGRLLGYPDCCSKAFVHRWRRALSDGSADPAKMILEELCSGGFAGTFGWETNIFARYFGHELIQHFPCRLDCTSTTESAHRNLAALSAFEKERAAVTREYLKYPVLFARQEGVAVFPEAKLSSNHKGARLEFEMSKVLVAESAVELKDALMRCRGQLSGSESHVQLGSKRIEGWLIDFR